MMHTYAVRDSLEGSGLRLGHVGGDGEEVTLQQPQAAGHLDAEPGLSRQPSFPPTHRVRRATSGQELGQRVS